MLESACSLSCPLPPDPSIDIDALSSSYNIAVATIRKSDTEFAYQLAITRAFAEGEAELLDEEDECLWIPFVALRSHSLMALS